MTHSIINRHLKWGCDRGLTGVVALLAVLAIPGCSGPRQTFRCDTEPECIQRSADECGGEDKFKLWSQNSKGAPKWWLMESRETFVIECMPDPTSNTYGSEMVPRRSSSG